MVRAGIAGVGALLLATSTGAEVREGIRLHQAHGPMAESLTAPVSAAPPPRPPTLELLPPGARSAADRVGLDRHSTSYGVRVVERIHRTHGARLGAAWHDVEYTIDPELDARIRAVLEQREVGLGHVVLMDPNGGEVFAYVSTDPQVFPATRPYPTASLMKVVTAAAVFEHAPSAVKRKCRTLGSPYVLDEERLEPLAWPTVEAGPDSEPAAEAVAAEVPHVDTLETALAISNNQCFGRFAVHDVGEAKLLDEMQRIGFLEAPGALHAPGRVEPVETPLDLGFLGSGLGGSFVTPLGAVRLAALLSEGKLVTPHWIAQVRDVQGRPVALPRRSPVRQVWPAETAEALRALLLGVTELGTARGAFVREDGERVLGPVQVAGKTGTLSGTNPAGRYQWFIGVAPADSPRVAIAAVVVGAPDAPGASASAVAADTLQAIFCAGEVCEPERAQRLHARAEARAAAFDHAIASELEEIVRNEAELDQLPRPLGVTGLDLPPHLLKRRARGRVVLEVELDELGAVVSVDVVESDLPRFDAFLVEKVRGWQFTPPTRAGRPVRAKARLPFPIRVN